LPRALLIAESSRPLLVAYTNFHHADRHGQNIAMLLTELVKTALRLPLIYRTRVQQLTLLSIQPMVHLADEDRGTRLYTPRTRTAVDAAEADVIT
jgi:hypothetical protein